MTSTSTFTVVYATDKRGRKIAWLEHVSGHKQRIPLNHADSMVQLNGTPHRYER